MKDNFIKKVQNLSNLKHNWDGYGANPITPNVIEDAVKLLEQLPENLMPSHYGPSPDNEIILEWSYYNHRNFILSLYGNGVVHCFADREQKLYFDDVPIENFNSSDLYKELQKYVENRNAGQCITK
jgi:hypothetical protein